jgi:hypothetical protein
MRVTASGSTKRLDIGQSLQDVLNVLLRNLLRLGLLGLVLAGVPFALLNLSNAYADQNPAFALLGLLGLLAVFITRPILYGAVIFLTVRELDGEPTSLRECLVAGRRQWGSLLGLMIVSGLAIGVGLVVLIVPGVYLALRWAVAGPSMVLSGRGISDSMQRSATLTEGRRWAMFLFYLIVFLVLLVALMLIGGLDGVLSLSGSKVLAATLVTPLANVLFDVSVPLVAAVLYRRLRGDAEGPATAALAEVFA